MTCWHSSFSSSKSHPFFLKSLILTHVFLSFSLSLSFALYLTSLSALSTRCPSPPVNLFFAFSFPRHFPLAPCRLAPPVPVWNDDLGCGSAGTSSHKELCECSEVKGEGEQRPAGRALCSSLASLECSTTSVAKVGGKSCLVRLTASVSLPYPLFSFPRLEE